MKNFDERRKERAARDRSFVIAGQTFVRKPGVRPEVMADYERLGEEQLTAKEVVEIIDGVILALIEDTPGANGDPSAYQRWRDARQRDDDPITFEDMHSLVEWLVQEDTGRPTQPPAPSSDGAETTGTPSTADSSSLATPAEQAA